MASVDDLLGGLMAEARSAVAGGDWETARSCLEDAVRRSDAAAALDELAQALFTLGDYTGAIERSEQAFARFRAEGDDARAAVCARFVGYLYWVVHGNGSKMNGWLARAVRLIDAVGDSPERARIELTLASVGGSSCATA